MLQLAVAVVVAASLLGEELLEHLVGLAHLAVYLLLAVELLVGKEQQAVALLVAAPVALQVGLLLLDLREEMEPLVVATQQGPVAAALVVTQVLAVMVANLVVVRLALEVQVAAVAAVALTSVAPHKVVAAGA